ncbi:Rieske (2Fe-2S) protein [Streptomyces sp. NPDC001530]|uniref:Rieske (2Fe-2S) protein n=1 Tax=Streptomyces sp. NPDC001530 TaxID=3364582 RepID=UPI0036739EEB
MAETSGIPGAVTRRTAVAGVGAAGLGAALAACGKNDKEQASPQDSATPSQGGESSAPPSQGAESSAAPSQVAESSAAPSARSGGTVLGKASDIPVGGGMIYANAKVVVTQPTSGDFKGFSAVCTHQGCTVAKVENGEIVCPCHKSHFSIADGSVASGPAPKPLPSADVTVADGTITLA